jgi:hypothetical protein
MPIAARVAVSGHPAKREVSSDNAVAVGSRVAAVAPPHCIGAENIISIHRHQGPQG